MCAEKVQTPLSSNNFSEFHYMSMGLTSEIYSAQTVTQRTEMFFFLCYLVKTV